LGIFAESKGFARLRLSMIKESKSQVILIDVDYPSMWAPFLVLFAAPVSFLAMPIDFFELKVDPCSAFVFVIKILVVM
jgi:hypothetical protein